MKIRMQQWRNIGRQSSSVPSSTANATDSESRSDRPSGAGIATASPTTKGASTESTSTTATKSSTIGIAMPSTSATRVQKPFDKPGNGIKTELVAKPIYYPGRLFTFKLTVLLFSKNVQI